MEGDADDSTVQDWEDKETQLVSKEVWRKIKEKVFKRRNLFIQNAKIISILLLKNLSHEKI